MPLMYCVMVLSSGVSTRPRCICVRWLGVDQDTVEEMAVIGASPRCITPPRILPAFLAQTHLSSGSSEGVIGIHVSSLGSAAPAVCGGHVVDIGSCDAVEMPTMTIAPEPES